MYRIGKGMPCLGMIVVDASPRRPTLTKNHTSKLKEAKRPRFALSATKKMFVYRNYWKPVLSNVSSLRKSHYKFKTSNNSATV